MLLMLWCVCAARISTKASPPVAPEAPYVAVPAAANSLQLEWPEPWGCGAPITGYLVDMAPADAVLTVQGPPTPPQVQLQVQPRPQLSLLQVLALCTQRNPAGSW